MSSRWPRWVYEQGEEPDYRFSFANERTFLAWIRTALGFIAGGVALDAFQLDLDPLLQRLSAAVLVAIGLGCAVSAWLRWALAERAMRRREPLPGQRFAPVMVALVLVLAAALVVSVF